ncbi:hypothetical protein [Spirosoma pollinicola]|uniref:hypothetical protein n=1 Tax=Spirosoma pollinicola TaxID=2057025 RepID=UPI0012FDDF36|nr:hypothetical protein [Spirosoma pollinicola]
MPPIETVEENLVPTNGEILNRDSRKETFGEVEENLVPTNGEILNRDSRKETFGE